MEAKRKIYYHYREGAPRIGYQMRGWVRNPEFSEEERKGWEFINTNVVDKIEEVDGKTFITTRSGSVYEAHYERWETRDGKPPKGLAS